MSRQEQLNLFGCRPFPRGWEPVPEAGLILGSSGSYGCFKWPGLSGPLRKSDVQSPSKTGNSVRQDSLLSFEPDFSKKNQEAMALGLKYLHRISGKIDILFKKWFRNLLFWTWLRSSPVGQANFATWIGLNGLNQPRCHKFMFGPDCEMQLSLSSKVSYDILQIQEKVFLIWVDIATPMPSNHGYRCK